ncbi:MAG: hypothetical protein A4E28_00226 [Methanocella sp. PtaU1.Bin125]|nr:MAG: hypothetical protein A4E28_00226 [Methanocella sp. PtaU1.Bin125]
MTGMPTSACFRMPKRLALLSFATQPVVESAMSNPLISTIFESSTATAAICVPPARIIGTFRAPIIKPMAPAIIGSPTRSMAVIGSTGPLMPAARSPSATTDDFSGCGFFCMLLLVKPSICSPIARSTPSAVVVPAGMVSPMTMNSDSAAICSPIFLAPSMIAFTLDTARPVRMSFPGPSPARKCGTSGGTLMPAST